MKRTSEFMLLTTLCCGIAAASGTSCRPSIEQECYEVLEYVAPPPDTLPPDLPYCSVTFGTVPRPPDGYGFTHRVGLAFVPTEDEPCDPCDVERFEEMFRAAIEERLSQGSPSCARKDPSDPVGLCVYQPDETTEMCSVLGVYFSNYHDVPVEHGCSDCRENDSCHYPR